MKAIGDSTDLHVVREEAHFDRACERAHRQAMDYFEIDAVNQSRRVKDWDRFSCYIRIEFKSYYRTGSSHCYLFTACAMRSEH